MTLRLTKLVRRLQDLMAPEDALVTAMPLLLAALLHLDSYLGLWERYRGYGPLHPARLAPFLLVGGGLWAVTASRPHRFGGDGDVWARLHLFAAWAGLLVGAPLLFLVLSDGDTGIIYVYAGLFALLSFGALGIAASKRALNLSPQLRRWLMAPFLAGSTWYATDRLVARYLYDAHHVEVILGPLRQGDPVGLFLGMVEAAFVLGLMVVPYVLLVIFPRFILGEVDGPWTWIRRYGWFALSVLVGLVWILWERW